MTLTDGELQAVGVIVSSLVSRAKKVKLDYHLVNVFFERSAQMGETSKGEELVGGIPLWQLVEETTKAILLAREVGTK